MPDLNVEADLQVDGLPVSGANPVPVALDAATLAALETVHAVIDSGEVTLDAAALAALENIIVTGTVALDAPTLAALESVTAAVTGSVELGATTLAALEAVTASISGTVTVSGTVNVGNFPVSTEIANDAGNPVPVSGTVAVSNLPATQPVSGTVEVTNDAGNPLPVSGTVTVQDGGGSVTVDLHTDDRDVLQDIRDGQAAASTTRFDYDVRTDANPVYIGVAPTGTATSSTGWTISKFAYDGSSRATRIDVRSGAWDDRASLGWGF